MFRHAPGFGVWLVTAWPAAAMMQLQALFLTRKPIPKPYPQRSDPNKSDPMLLCSHTFIIDLTLHFALNLTLQPKERFLTLYKPITNPITNVLTLTNPIPHSSAHNFNQTQPLPRPKPLPNLDS